MFIKEDEDLYPDLDYSPVAERTTRRHRGDRAGRDQRGGLGLVYSPARHGAPAPDRRDRAGGRRGGCLGRDVQRDLRGRNGPDGPRGHQATCPTRRPSTGITPGIGVKTRGIWREVIDFLARLDGIDFRQTAPVRPGSPVHPPLWRRVARLRGRPHPADRRDQPHHDHPRRGPRPGEHHPQPPRRRVARGSPRTCCSWPARRSTRSRTRAARPTRGSASRRCSRRSRSIARASSRISRWRST